MRPTDTDELRAQLQKAVALTKRLTLKQKRLLMTAATVLLLLTLTVPFTGSTWAVSVDGKTVGYTRDQEDTLELARGILEADGTVEENVATVEMTPVQDRKVKLTPKEELKENLTQALLRLQEGWVVKINGMAIATLATKEAAETVVEKVKTSFPPEEGSEIKKVHIKEEVEIAPQVARAATISEVDEAVALLIRGTNEEREYEIKAGDSLWSIARAHDMYVDDIIAANPGITENLQIDQKISLVVPKPYVTVVSREEKTVVEAIPFETQTVKDNSLYNYERKVRTAGKPGSKRTTYAMVRENGLIVEQTAINELIEEEPTTQVMAVGTKQPAVVATGRYTWPVSRGGYVSSRYGRRGGGFHSGVDIAAPRGTPVIASDNGVVTYAGWNGGYGKCIILSHGGCSTLYGHLSQITAKHGQKVQKGQTIGLVGSTGKSTGPHLHFEIREGGSSKNPLLYFKHQ